MSDLENRVLRLEKRVTRINRAMLLHNEAMTRLNKALTLFTGWAEDTEDWKEQYTERSNRFNDTEGKAK